MKRKRNYPATSSTELLLARGHAEGVFAGVDAPVWQCDSEQLISASVTVYRLAGGHRQPYVGVAWLKESPAAKSKHPRRELAREALTAALEMAFPDESLLPYEPFFEPEEKGKRGR